MLAIGKPVCLLKDRTLKTLQSDLVGKLYRGFDPQQPKAQIAKAISAWLSDKGLSASAVPEAELPQRVSQPVSRARADGELKLRIHDLFPIEDKDFDDAMRPQKLLVTFKNRGSEDIQIKQVKYASYAYGGLPESAVASVYTRSHDRYHLIPFEQGEVAPGETFGVEIRLGQVWNAADLRRMGGKWGYLRIELIYGNQPTEWFASF